ncbi:MAG TPA: sugar transferase, partial [Desulfuromonadales bacterium]|nr:sugar transferase [Desulfuromonadales bacterium]
MGKTLIILMGGDFFIALMAHYLGGLLRIGGPGAEADFRATVIRVAVFAVVLVFTTYFTELYSYERRYGVKESFLRVLMSLILTFFILSTIYFVKPAWAIRVLPLLASLGVFGLVQFLWHNRYPFLLHVPGIAQKVFIFGVGPLAQKMEMVLAMSNNAYTFAGFVEPASDLNTVSQESVVANTSTLIDAARKDNVSTIVVSLSERRGVLPVQAILGCKLQGIEIIDAQTFYEHITGKLMIEEINPSWFIFSDGFHVTTFMRFYKRIFDLFFSGLGLLFVLPLFPLIALAIKLDSPGPVIFKQLRVGRGEERFRLYKFRTMRQDAEKGSGAVWAQKHDPRVTRVGSFL